MLKKTQNFKKVFVWGWG